MGVVFVRASKNANEALPLLARWMRASAFSFEHKLSTKQPCNNMHVHEINKHASQACTIHQHAYVY